MPPLDAAPLTLPALKGGVSRANREAIKEKRKSPSPNEDVQKTTLGDEFCVVP
jgi:hypothetical protein